MDRRALIIGGSGGIGKALVAHLTSSQTNVSELSRSTDGFDITSEEQIAQAMGNLPVSSIWL